VIGGLELAAIVRPAVLVERRIHVGQGAHHVSADPDVVLSTILGSCVSACIRDPLARVGGMNHFLLPEAPDGEAGDRRYGVQAMELLINSLLSQGARRDRLEAKVFGGGRMTVGLADIGLKNAEFAKRFLRDEDIRIVGESLGGDKARRLHYYPVSGRASQSLVRDSAVMDSERKLTLRATPSPAGSGDLELFS
jgi:chemotaxis protein CheD